MTGPGASPDLDENLRRRVEALIEDGLSIWEDFDQRVRTQHWHPFIPANYHTVLRDLEKLRAPGLRFLEWGSATGIITIMADMLGYEAYGMELDAQLVSIARNLAQRHHSAARFVVGSFVPAGYRSPLKDGEGRTGTIGDGPSAYIELGMALDDFDLVYAYPWRGEERALIDIMRQYGRPGARLMLYGDEGSNLLPIGTPES
jgi:hypothetical protein